jgi:hypothetical protein
MKLIIITYDESKTYNDCYNRYKEMGYDPEPFMGLNAIKENINKTHICYINFKNCLKKYINYDGDLLISEDDAYLVRKIDIENKDEINWLGWVRGGLNAKVTGGTTLLYISKKKIHEILHKMDNNNPVHLDYYFNKYIDTIIAPISYTKEIEHHSIIYGGVRTHKKVIKL